MDDGPPARPALRVIEGGAGSPDGTGPARPPTAAELAEAARLELARRHSPVLHERVVRLTPDEPDLRAILDDFCPPEIRSLFAAEIAMEVLAEIKRRRKRGPYKRQSDPETGKPKKLKTGFASMPKDKVLAAAKAGGKKVQAMGTGHRWKTREEARRAGLKGGSAPHTKRGIHPVNEKQVAEAIRKLIGPAPKASTSGDASREAEAP